MDLVAFPDSDWLDWLRTRVRGNLDEAKRLVGEVKAADPDQVLMRWNDAAMAVADAASVSSVLGAVHPEPAVRELAEESEVEASTFMTDVYLDPDVYAALSGATAADAAAQRVLDLALREFRRSGVDRDEATRERVRELHRRVTEIDQAFGRSIREGRRTVRVPVAALDGLPEDFVAEHPADGAGTVEISTDYTDTHPFAAMSTDDAARRTVMRSFLDLAWPENGQVLADLLAARHELATTLGYADWPSYDAEVKMIGSGPAIGTFIDSIAAASGEPGKVEIAALEETLGAPIDLSNSRFAMERHRREHFDVDSTEVRRYFDFAKVRAGLLEVTGRLFGLSYEPVDAPSWHPDVASYDVLVDGDLLGRIHLDLHPREGKYNHAAQFDLVPGVRDRQLPEGVLVCNFPRGLMEHRDVVTLFHEFGHLMHHVLAGRHDWVRFSGVATEWDFVEAPSQMLEEWAWDAAVLRTFAIDGDGNAIPEDLVERMRAAEEFGRAYLARTQMYYAAISYRFHLERPADLTARMQELAAQYSLVGPLDGTHFFCGFGHLGGYSSGYYTYMWSQTIAKDMFTAFDRDDLFAPGPATRYRDCVLVPGGSKDAADLVADFLGRPFNTDAFEGWLNG
ncbi:MAG TPA: M3 family metallopeptidase [Marmoricola sp.]